MRDAKWLKKALERVKIPKEDPVARDRALERALIALRNPDVQENSIEAPGHGLRWGVLALVALIAGLTTVYFHGADRTSKTAAREILDQVAKIFPGKLVAVIERDGQMDVQLANDEIAPSTQPVLLILKRGKESVRVLSYSGREVCLELDGRKTCLEMLARGNGEVIVSGDSFLWSRQNPLALDGYQIEASALSSPL